MDIVGLTQEEISTVTAADIRDNGSDKSLEASAEEAREILALERDGLGPNDKEMPFAPMMTYQKYLTMQVSMFDNCYIFLVVAMQ